MHLPHQRFHLHGRSVSSEDKNPTISTIPSPDETISFRNILSTSIPPDSVMAPATSATDPSLNNYELVTRAKGSPAYCDFKNSGLPLLNQGTTAHQAILVAIGIGAGVVLTFLVKWILNRKKGSGGDAGTAAAADPKP